MLMGQSVFTFWPISFLFVKIEKNVATCRFMVYDYYRKLLRMKGF